MKAVKATSLTLPSTATACGPATSSWLDAWAPGGIAHASAINASSADRASSATDDARGLDAPIAPADRGRARLLILRRPSLIIAIGALSLAKPRAPTRGVPRDVRPRESRLPATSVEPAPRLAREEESRTPC